MTQTILNNARIVLSGEVVDGSVAVEDGRIVDIGTASSLPAAVDLEGDYLLPGLIELHTDHLEGHYAPRAHVRWEPATAVLSHDAQLACAGVTTVFDALRIGLDAFSEMKIEDMRVLSDAIRAGVAGGRLRADHRIHLRCEVSAPDCGPAFEAVLDDPLVGLASLMDHAPGQRQFQDVAAYKAFMRRRMPVSDAEFDAFCTLRLEQSGTHSAHNRTAIAAACRARNVVLASHDDATAAHVAEAKTLGVAISEFPTTGEAANAARTGGLSILMGAPNVVRGRSHSGNISARDLAGRGGVDILSSDYIPFSLLQAVFSLTEGETAIDLVDAVAMVTRNPARAVGLADRGEIAPGRRADLVRVHLQETIPVVRTVWREGRRVA